MPFWIFLKNLFLLSFFGFKISQQRLTFIEQHDDYNHQTGEVRNECVIVAKRHQKFPSARGYGPFMVPSRCPCLAWRSLFGAVPFWPLLVPFALLAPFGPFWPLLPSWPLLGCYGPLGRLPAYLRTPRHNHYYPIRVLGANGPGLAYRTNQNRLFLFDKLSSKKFIQTSFGLSFLSLLS